jgi:hypothetical protein
LKAGKITTNTNGPNYIYFAGGLITAIARKKSLITDKRIIFILEIDPQFPGDEQGFVASGRIE